MLWSQNVARTSPLKLGLLVCASFLLGLSCALPDASRNPCQFKMALQNFRSILSWTFKNHSIVPTHYTLWFTVMSKNNSMETVEGCTNISRPSCDLTDTWTDLGETYVPQVDGFRANTLVGSCLDEIRLASDMSLEPPEFDIVGLADRVDVTVRFPPVLPKVVKDLQYNSPLMLSLQEGKVVKERKLTDSKNMTGNFTFIFDNLVPNTNYCVSIYYKKRHAEPKPVDVKPAVKCTFLQPRMESVSSESDKAGGIVITFVLLALTVTIFILKRTGYICLQNEFPHILYFKPLSTCAFLHLLPMEATDPVEVILVPRKKKKDSNSEEASDSDQEEVPQISAGGYTMHGLVGRPLDQASASSDALEEPTQLDSEEEDQPEPEADLELPLAPSEHPGGGVREGSREPPQGFWPVEDSLPEELGDRRTFNVDLKSVCVRVLEEDPDEVPPLPALQEETADPEDAEDLDLLLAFQARTAPPSHGPPEEDQWADSLPSEDSGASESEADIGDGYLAR